MGSWRRGGARSCPLGSAPDTDPQVRAVLQGERMAREESRTSTGEGWHRGPVLGGSSTDWGQSPGPPATLDVGDPSWACKAEARDLFKHLSSGHLGRRLSSQVWGGQVPGGI